MDVFRKKQQNMALSFLLMLTLFVSSTRSMNWSPVTCPAEGHPFPSTCTQPALETDAAVTLFFQMESSGTVGGAFTCTDQEVPSVTYCARNWTQPETGSVGSCFFLLPAGRRYTCAASDGGISVIDAQRAFLSDTSSILGSPTSLSCPSKVIIINEGCTEPSSPLDRWVVASFHGVGGGAAFSCAANGVTVCSFASSTSGSGPGDTSSCSFLLPSNTSMVCQAQRGSVLFDHAATAFEINKQYGSFSKKLVPPCPPAGPQPNDCDCSLSIAGNLTDALVAITATTDSNFNSFHCYIDGVNVCGIGFNKGMSGAAATCFFVLPAGGQYDCSMEWGAATFTATSVSMASSSLFGVSTGRRRRRGYASADAAHDPDEQRLARLWQRWKEEHRDVATDKHSFRNFRNHVAAADDAAAKHIKILSHPDIDEWGRPTRFNAFATMSRGEWVRTYRGKAHKGISFGSDDVVPAPPPAPSAWDWRDQGAVTPVKDQGQCGSCWAFSTTGSIESAWAVAKNPLLSLSEQELVSCCNTSDGCDGGWPYAAMEWIAINGANTESSYPYVSGDGVVPKCSAPSGKAAPVNVTGWRLVPGSEAAMADWLAAYGPVSILVDAMTQLWWTYTGGVMTKCCDTTIDHAVLLVGYNESKTDGKYWIIKNSWGSSWGEDGYVRLARGGNECGITTYPVIPCVEGGVLPPPPPPPPPRPVWICPADAVSRNTTTTAACLWINATASGVWEMPPVVGEYCDYITSGYMGYSFPTSEPNAKWPCPPSFRQGNNGGSDYFCVLTVGVNNFTGFPKGVKAECGNVTDGIIGYSWSR